jgi:hypothetical protein
MMKLSYIGNNSQELKKEEQDANFFQKKNWIASTCVEVVLGTN